MSHSNIKSITPLLLQELINLNQKGFLIIDVREEGEYQNGHIAGSENIPLSKLQLDIDVLDSITHREIVMVCQAGVRSMLACQLIRNSGKSFETWNLEGGMSAWYRDIVI